MGWEGIHSMYLGQSREEFVDLKTDDLDKVIDENHVRGVVEPLRMLANNSGGGWSLELIIKLALLYGIRAGYIKARRELQTLEPTPPLHTHRLDGSWRE